MPELVRSIELNGHVLQLLMLLPLKLRGSGELTYSPVVDCWDSLEDRSWAFPR